MRRSTYVEFNKIGFSLLWSFCDLLWFFKDLVKIKNKRKIEKPLPPHPQTAQGGYLNGFVSLRRLDGRFCGPERKSRFSSKLREAKRTFFPIRKASPLMIQAGIKYTVWRILAAAPYNWAQLAFETQSTHVLLVIPNLFNIYS